MNKDMLRQIYRTNKYLGEIPIPDEGTYKKHDDMMNTETVIGIYGRGFVFHNGKLSMIYSRRKERNFEKYTDDLWILPIGGAL